MKYTLTYNKPWNAVAKTRFQTCSSVEQCRIKVGVRAVDCSWEGFFEQKNQNTGDFVPYISVLHAVWTVFDFLNLITC